MAGRRLPASPSWISAFTVPSFGTSEAPAEETSDDLSRQQRQRAAKLDARLQHLPEQALYADRCTVGS
jgi:hypothetical protein